MAELKMVYKWGMINYLRYLGWSRDVIYSENFRNPDEFSERNHFTLWLLHVLPIECDFFGMAQGALWKNQWQRIKESFPSPAHHVDMHVSCFKHAWTNCVCGSSLQFLAGKWQSKPRLVFGKRSSKQVFKNKRKKRTPATCNPELNFNNSMIFLLISSWLFGSGPWSSGGASQ